MAYKSYPNIPVGCVLVAMTTRNSAASTSS